MVSRREFVKTSALGAIAALFPHAAYAAGRARAEFTLLRRNVGIFTDRGGTMGWLINNDGVLVIDSQFADTAPLFLDGLRERTQRQIDVLINTHHHPDHTGGNLALRPVTRSIVAHTRAVENQRNSARQRNAEDSQAYADITIDDTWSVQIGDETVRAKYYGPAHTGGDIALFFENANIVHLGDLLNNRGWPNVDAPAGGSVHGWVRVLETIAPEYGSDTIFIYGHAEAGYPFTGTRDDLFYQRDYFNAVIDAARQGLAQGRSRDEVTSITTLRGFENLGGTASRLGLALGIAYDELVETR